ncbi:MAG TPA: tetratricopeptide repeat protein, partial [Methanothrix soehngenii]|nr:tetratricopeptide repeat protein [Methanothrix soehngenii]
MIETKLKLILAFMVLLATVVMPAFGQQTAAEWLEKGNAFVMLSMYDEAIQAYDQAISIDPQDAYAWSNKGEA